MLVPGFWLGAWAWDEVAGLLRAEGHDVTALTLPGLESKDTDRSKITLEDHVDAIVRAVEDADESVVLVVHSGTGFSGYAASDRVPDRIAAMVYVDSAPGIGAMWAPFEDVENAMPSPEELAKTENLDGLSGEQLAEFQRRAVPEPGAILREAATLTNDARLDIPTTIICTGATSEQMKAWAKERPTWLAGLSEVRNVSYVDLPTSHWPMWSRPKELAAIIGEVANMHTHATSDSTRGSVSP